MFAFTIYDGGKPLLLGMKLFALCSRPRLAAVRLADQIAELECTASRLGVTRSFSPTAATEVGKQRDYVKTR
jgi:hypothetical protein